MFIALLQQQQILYQQLYNLNNGVTTVVEVLQYYNINIRRIHTLNLYNCGHSKTNNQLKHITMHFNNFNDYYYYNKVLCYMYL